MQPRTVLELWWVGTGPAAQHGPDAQTCGLAYPRACLLIQVSKINAAAT